MGDEPKKLINADPADWFIGWLSPHAMTAGNVCIVEMSFDPPHRKAIGHNLIESRHVGIKMPPAPHRGGKRGD